MLEQVLQYLRNWFLAPNGIYAGTFTVEGGSLVLPFLQTGQYFRVIGSVFNDGVYQYPPEQLKNEKFNGIVWALAVPKAVLDLVEEITTWQEKNGEAATGPYQSESFGGYTYAKAVDSETGGAMTWERTFAGQLSQWRKL